MPRPLPRSERETIISRTADQKEWLVYTTDPVVKRRLARITTAIGISATEVEGSGLQVRLPLSCVRFTTPIVVSAQERANRVERGRQLAAARMSLLPQISSDKL